MTRNLNQLSNSSTIYIVKTIYCLLARTIGHRISQNGRWVIKLRHGFRRRNHFFVPMQQEKWRLKRKREFASRCSWLTRLTRWKSSLPCFVSFFHVILVRLMLGPYSSKEKIVIKFKEQKPKWTSANFFLKKEIK